MLGFSKKEKIRAIARRIFYSEEHKNVFLRRLAIARSEHYVRWICGLKRAFNDENNGEIRRRQHYLHGEGIRPPQTMADCDKLIMDLRKWREM